jgi:phosphoribosylformylglycinamidine synthase
MPSTTPSAGVLTVHRVEVRPRRGVPDAAGEGALRAIEGLGISPAPQRVEVTDVYLIEGGLDAAAAARVAEDLLADPVTQQPRLGAAAARGDALVEVHPLPGVMDPDAEPVEVAIGAMLGIEVRVRTGRRYDLFGIPADSARALAERALANPVIHDIHLRPYHPARFAVGQPYEGAMGTVALRGLSREQLQRLSREAHLFLSAAEMEAIQQACRGQGRDPREIELETLAQTWSEHCVHKTLRAEIRYRGPVPRLEGRRHLLRDNGDGSVTIPNLLRCTIAAATHELMADGVDWCLSVFEDNSGVIAFDATHAVCFKVETHNHPSAIEPYGGAATGVGGCIRDIMGTGLGAMPIASTDVFCVAPPDPDRVPAGCLHPRRILSQVVAGVRDYGNRMGIPTVNGAVWFDPRYVGNPLVYCGCVGVMPRDRVRGRARAGDRIVALGGRTGRDGIHGATFSSSELTDAHADEFAHAVQIGNPVTQKKLLDALLQARDHPAGCLYHAVTDCGAGGFSSAVGEMGSGLGAQVELDRAPLKYEGLSPTEIWISEAQERMILSVPAGRLEELRAVCRRHEVELCELGHFGTEGAQLILRHRGAEVGRLDMAFLHGGRPQSRLEASWPAAEESGAAGPPPRDGGRVPDLGKALLALLAHPNIASKHWIIRQYDHEVQGGAVVNPLVGAACDGPSDGAVLLPVAGSARGLALANGLATGLEGDPYVMALAAIDECVRNLVCVGADPDRIALLDNFCWPSCDEARTLGGLVRAAMGCYDAAKAYRTPFISGKDSLNNQFKTEDGEVIRIPPTLLISGMGIVPDVARCVTMDAKAAGNLLLLVGPPGGTRRPHGHLTALRGATTAAPDPDWVDLHAGPATARAVHRAISAGLVRAAHDCSDGGLLVAVAEMAIAGRLGASLEIDRAAGGDLLDACFSEEPSRYLLEVAAADLSRVQTALAAGPVAVPSVVLGRFERAPRLRLAARGGDAAALEVTLSDLQAAWRRTLDW